MPATAIPASMAPSRPMRNPASVDTTRELLLSLFPPEVHKNASLLHLAHLVETFTRAGTRRARLDAFVDLCSWLRVLDSRIPDLKAAAIFPALNSSEWRRERVWLSILYSSEEIRD